MGSGWQIFQHGFSSDFIFRNSRELGGTRSWSWQVVGFFWSSDEVNDRFRKSAELGFQIIGTPRNSEFSPHCVRKWLHRVRKWRHSRQRLLWNAFSHLSSLLSTLFSTKCRRSPWTWAQVRPFIRFLVIFYRIILFCWIFKIRFLQDIAKCMFGYTISVRYSREWDSERVMCRGQWTVEALSAGNSFRGSGRSSFDLVTTHESGLNIDREIMSCFQIHGFSTDYLYLLL